MNQSKYVPSVPGQGPLFLDERGARTLRTVFGELLNVSTGVESAVRRIRLSTVNLSAREVSGLHRLCVLVSEVNARTVEAEAYALDADPGKRENLRRIVELLKDGRLEIRSAPLGGWSPDFSVFSRDDEPQAVLMGLHWFRRPFPHRGPAWAAVFGAEEARKAHLRFREVWSSAHDIGPAVLRLLERSRADFRIEAAQPRLPAPG
jgi:hypothetical protein